MALNFEKDENGLYILSKGTDPWDQGMNENFRILGTQMSNKVNRTPPTEYDFPFCQGFKKYKKCSYYMTQENQVVLNLAVEAEQDFTGYDLIGMLPAGFRPDEMIEAPGAVSGGAFATFGIYPDGSVRLLLHGKVGENPYAYTSTIVYRAAHQ